MSKGKKPKSKYARKEAWRLKHCGGAPLPFFPEVMAMRVKPWGTEKLS